MKLLGSDRRAEDAVENVVTSTILAATTGAKREREERKKEEKKRKKMKKGKTVQTRLKTNIMCSSYAHSVQSVKIHVLLAFVQRLA